MKSWRSDYSSICDDGEFIPNLMDYWLAVEVANGFIELGMHEEAIATLRQWPVDEVPGSMQVLVGALIRQKRYEEAVQEGLRIRVNARAYSCEDAFELAVALNACGRHGEAQDLWIDALITEDRPVFHYGLACELTHLGDLPEALAEYCKAVRAGHRVGSYDLADPDLTPMWAYAATTEPGREEAGVFSDAFWDNVIGNAYGQRHLPNQGHSTIRDLEVPERELMEWDALRSTFVISNAARRKSPELAAALERKLWRWFRGNLRNLCSTVERARKKIIKYTTL